VNATRYEQMAIRTFSETKGGAHDERRPSPRTFNLPEHMLVLDTETTTDAAQALLFGSARLIAVNSKKHARGTCLREVIFYADDLPVRDPRGFEILQQYMRDNCADIDTERVRKRIGFMSRREFIDGEFYKLAYKAQCLVVGFNLFFDLPRLAVAASDARRSYGGGVSLTLWDYEDAGGMRSENSYRPRLLMKSLGSKGQLIQFTDRLEGDPEDYEIVEVEGGQKRRAFKGHFLDAHTLDFALSNCARGLAKACEAWGVEHGKGEAEEHGVITPAYIDYNRRDVKATGELTVKLLDEFECHPISLQPTRAYSPASIAKSYLQTLGIVPPLARQPDFPRDVLGYAMCAYYGGRAECRIRRVPLPVRYVDFLSMYPTVNALMDNWSLLTADHIDVVDATEDVRTFVDSVTAEDCFDPATWRRLPAFVQVLPQGEVFPVRTRYESGGQSYQIGSNYLTSRTPLWYALPDVVAAKLLSGDNPEIVRAVRIQPSGQQSGLRPAKLRGRVRVDPRTSDFFRSVIEERKRSAADENLSEAERQRLNTALKTIANAGSYGIFAQMDRKELPSGKRAEVELWGLTGEPFTNRLATPEEAGPFCFPPLAALITAGAKLMLALLETVVTERGGSYVFCDTDSMAIVASEHVHLVPCPGGSHVTNDGREAVKALSWDEVDEIAELFERLKPYDPAAVPGSVLETEKENFDRVTDEPRELHCYAISAKRYALFNLEDGEPVIRKRSAHGLGHLLNPKDPDRPDDHWIDETWRAVVREDALGLPTEEPTWYARPAVSRLGVSSAPMLALFREFNCGKAYADQVKPGNFMLAAQVADLGHPRGVDPKRFQLVAPYNPKPGKWLAMRWMDRYSGETYRATLSEHSSLEGEARLKTYSDVIRAYRFHPEFKSDAPDGGPCGRKTRGLLARTHVEAIGFVYIGKESNKLEEVEDGVIHDLGEVLNEYADVRSDEFSTLALPVLRKMLVPRIVAESGLNPSTVKRIRSGRQRPHPDNREALMSIAAKFAREALSSAGVEPASSDAAALYLFLQKVATA
jgi:hypothetical protein